ncbi:MAG: YitT family protein [Bacteroides sp.]|nr:YitT family protein [Bacillota bacterium]MCM1393802.1 YitT family protein [[Eubacterium] siraeum]MCM1455121.1 YitT family protein [Bacteroides sp.]
MENEILEDTSAQADEARATEIVTADTLSEAQPAEVSQKAAAPAAEETTEETFYMRGKKQVAIKHYKVGKFDFTNKNAYSLFRYALLLVLLASLRSITTYMFIVPNGFAPGGVSGISSILYNIVVLIEPNNPTLRTIFDPGITMLVLNIPFIIASFFVLGKKFAINTFFVVAVYSGLMFLLGAVDCPQFIADQAGYKILAALAGGSCAGFCLTFMLRHDMSMAGTDIVGKILHKHNPETGAQWWILICDCTVATCSGALGIISVVQNHTPANEAFLAVLSPILFSFIALITGSITTDIMQTGFQSSIVFNIITDKSDEIALAISERLHRGVTVSTAVGYFTKAEHKILTCIVTKRQITQVKAIIKECDPNAFTYLTKAHEVAGKGFHSAG